MGLRWHDHAPAAGAEPRSVAAGLAGTDTPRLQSNQDARTKAILDGNVVLYAELPVEEVATDIMAYVVSADTAAG